MDNYTESNNYPFCQITPYKYTVIHNYAPSMFQDNVRQDARVEMMIVKYKETGKTGDDVEIMNQLISF